MQPLAIPGAWLYQPRVFGDQRGAFFEAYRAADASGAVGHPLSVAQTNVSVSRRGTVRGVHFADVPPGQAKYVTCLRGAILDVVVDIRVGSPTFGKSEAVRLDDEARSALYIAEGLGHAFIALTDDATVHYLCSEPYRPAGEHAVNPLDPNLGIAWPRDVELVLSDKDAAAPSLREAADADLLPSYDACEQLYKSLDERQLRR